MENQAIVRVEDATKIYKQGIVEVRAVDDISFQIKTGDFAALCGPSGSGKTTVLNLIGGHRLWIREIKSQVIGRDQTTLLGD